MRRLLNRAGYDVANIPVGRPGRDLFEDVRRLSKSSVKSVLDVGGHVGKSALEYHLEFPNARIFSFEPVRETYGELCRSVANRSRIVPLNIALGDSIACAAMHLHVGPDQNSFLQDAPEAKSFVGAKFFESAGDAQVKVTTLDEVCRKYAIPFIDFMKIDTQGYELRVLKGARETLVNRRIRLLLLEINFIPLYADQPTFAELSSLLESFDYGLVGFYNQVYHEKGYLMWTDALFVFRDSIK
jgi:FkbM family methyltransferase